MTLPNLLIMRKGTPIQVYIQSPTLTRTQDGNDLPSAGSDDRPWPSDAGRRNASRVISQVAEAFGKRFCIYQNTIRERDEGGDGNWGITYTFADAVNNNVHSGLAVCNDNGQEILGGFYWGQTGTGPINVVFTRDGNTWEEDSLGTTNLSGVGTLLPWRNSLYWLAECASGTIGSSFLIGYDFTTATPFIATNITGVPTSPAEGTIIIHKNNLFMLGLRGQGAAPSGSWYLLRLTGTSWTEVWHSTSTFGGGWPNEHGPAIWTDLSTGDLMLMFMTNNSPGNGFEVRQIIDADTASGLTDPSLPGGSSANVIDLSPTVVPSALQKGTLANGPDTLNCFVNNVDNPGTTEVYIIHNNEEGDTGGSHTYYLWNGVSSVMTTYGAATTTAADWIPVNDNRGGGERVPTIPAGRPVFDGGVLLEHGTVTGGPFQIEDVITGTSGTAIVRTVYSGSLDVEVTSGTFSNGDSISGSLSGASATLTMDSKDLSTPVEIPGGTTRVYFRVHGTGSAFSAEVRLSVDENPPTALMSLLATSVAVEAGSPATTPTNTTTQINNLTPDGGSTIYSVQINTTAAGIGAGDGYAIMLAPV